MRYADFRGERSGTAPLTWGQRAIWNAIANTAPGDHYFNFGRVLALPDRLACPVDVAVAALGALVSRHESLRTRVDPLPAQVLADSGRLPVLVVDDDRPDEAAARLSAELAGTRFDYAGEWPLRVALVTREGLVRHVVLVFCHLAADGHGADLVVRDLRLLLRSARSGRPIPAALPPPVRQPLDLAAEQHSAEGRRLSDAALAFWRNGLRSVPPTMFGTPAGPAAQPRYWAGRLTSPAVDLALEVLAHRHRVSTSTVLLAASATMVGHVTGHRTVAMMPIVNNRFHSGHRDLVSTLSQDGLFVLDLDAATFDTVVERAWPAALAAYRHARYDPVAWTGVFAEVSAARGVPTHPFCCFNDMRLVDRPADPDRRAPDPAGPRAALDRSRFAWTDRIESLDCRFCLHVSNEPGGLGIQLTADTGYLPPAGIEGYLRGLEALLVAAADGEVCLEDFTGLTRSGRR